ncbi:MAG: hypothetical protein BWY10_02598 [Chloroflexi bacterium ADurb.Bin180]|nr:MAG: hypothetical protein BWY10_02598 [Chloroflexi bacterium ADurb.Bin180]
MSLRVARDAMSPKMMVVQSTTTGLPPSRLISSMIDSTHDERRWCEQPCSPMWILRPTVSPGLNSSPSPASRKTLTALNLMLSARLLARSFMKNTSEAIVPSLVCL